jgi:hypothetical protein
MLPTLPSGEGDESAEERSVESLFLVRITCEQISVEESQHGMNGICSSVCQQPLTSLEISKWHFREILDSTRLNNVENIKHA